LDGEILKEGNEGEGSDDDRVDYRSDEED